MSTIRVLGASLLFALAANAAAQQYPTRNISMIVPYAAGGPTDTVARVLAQAMGKPLGQTVIVENRPSAGGILGPEQVKNEARRLHDPHPSHRHGDDADALPAAAVQPAHRLRVHR